MQLSLRESLPLSVLLGGLCDLARVAGQGELYPLPLTFVCKPNTVTTNFDKLPMHEGLDFERIRSCCLDVHKQVCHPPRDLTRPPFRKLLPNIQVYITPLLVCTVECSYIKACYL